MIIKSSNKEVLAASLLSSWKKNDRITVSVDAKLHAALFPFIPILHTVHAKSDFEPILLILKRATAVSLLEERYNLKGK